MALTAVWRSVTMIEPPTSDQGRIDSWLYSDGIIQVFLVQVYQSLIESIQGHNKELPVLILRLTIFDICIELGKGLVFV